MSTSIHLSSQGASNGAFYFSYHYSSCDDSYKASHVDSHEASHYEDVKYIMKER